MSKTATETVEVLGVWHDPGTDEMELEVRNPETGVAYALRSTAFLGRAVAELVTQQGPRRVEALPSALRPLPYA